MRREKFLKIFSLHSDDRHYAFFIKNEMCGKENQKNSWVCEKKKPKANFIKNNDCVSIWRKTEQFIIL